MQIILIVCIGNICRSPMAEGLLREALPGRTIISAGLGAVAGQAADPFAVQIMQEQGIDISGHRAQSISSRLIRQADLILTMDSEQKRFVEVQFIGAKGKVFRLGEFRKIDISDPYRQSIDQFRTAFQLIHQGLTDIVKRVMQIEPAGANRAQKN